MLVGARRRAAAGLRPGWRPVGAHVAYSATLGALPCEGS